MKLGLKEHRRYLLLFSCAILLVFSTLAIDFFFQFKRPAFSTRVLSFETNLHNLEKEASSSLEDIQVKHRMSKKFSMDIFNPSIQKKGLTFLIYFNDSLISWSDNQAAYDDIHKQNIPENKLLKLKNGWYEVLQKKEKEYTFYALILIKSEYYIQNTYLQNYINPALGVFLQDEISFSEKQEKFPVHDSHNHFLFSLERIKDVEFHLQDTILLILYLLSMVLICIGIHQFLVEQFKRPGKLKYLLLLILPALKSICGFYKIPKALYELDLFGPQQYASSFWLNSLGDFLINTLLFVYLFRFVYKVFLNAKNKNSNHKNIFLYDILIVLLFVFIFFFSAGINYLLSGMIINSKINFDVNNIFDLNIYSYIGFLITGALLYVFYLFTDGVILYVHSSGRSYSTRIILFLLAVAFFGSIILYFPDFELFKEYDFDTFLLALALIFLIQFVRFYHSNLNNDQRLTLSRTMLVILFFSVYSAQTLYEFNIKKEREHLKIISSKLLSERDYVAEYLFQDIENKISQDTIISHVFLTENENEIELKTDKRLHALYLNAYWNKYDIRVFCFDEDGDIYPNVNNMSVTVDEYEKLIRTQGKSTYGNHLFFMNSETGRISYLAYIPLQKKNGIKHGTIVIEFASKLIHEKIGFPDIFLAEKAFYDQELSKYSYARYKNDELVNQSGSYSYYLNPSIFNLSMGEYRSMIYEGYNHFIYKPNKSSLVVISRPVDFAFTYFTLLSYFFAFYCISVFLYYLGRHLYFSGFVFDMNFKTRIQTTFLLIVFILMITIGGGTIYYLVIKNMDKQVSFIEEKVTSLLVLLENELHENRSGKLTFNADQEIVLNTLSNNIGANFNMYNVQGSLVFSSQPKIYESGIMASKMHPEAWAKFHLNQRTFFTQQEKIGALRYIAAYQPIRNVNNQVIGYLNLPYFAKQSELNKEISSFIVVLINIYVLIFMLALLVVFVIADRLTKPLKIIRDKLRSTRLDNTNEPIVWGKNDEIGELVEVYNRMLDELALSAEKLARSERESAWREMAKQVAHEIKNPLTPMKLSVQYLQKAWQDQSPEIDTIIARISKTIVEQIDTLSIIASEFSNFAQMPKTEKIVLNLADLLQNALALFEGMQDVSLSMQANSNEEAWVLADKNQLLRAFNNVLQNAIQSIPENKHGIITVHLQSSKGMHLIRISDNGSGISDEQIPFVFYPNFTTKTAGMGLGLAMVKNIIESSSGKIWFETQFNVGTTFYMQLPAENALNL